MPTVSVIVPTYEEAENLPLLARRIDAALSGYDYEVIVVDDNSPDEIFDTVARLKNALPIRLITRTNDRGLATAVICGMNQAQGNYLICMDADLSHPPEVLPQVVAALDEAPSRFIVCSRYIDDASTPREWSLLRRLNSSIATLLARPIVSVSDPMSGYFGLSRSTFCSARELNPSGYKIALELLVRCRYQDIVEIPIQFAERNAGRSKLNLEEQIKYLRHLSRLYWFKLRSKARPETAVARKAASP